MNIVLHCSGMPFNGETINQFSLGGSETSAYYMAKELVNLGHDVTVFTNHQESGKWDGVNYIFMGEVNEAFPLGMSFEYYARNTPHDVLIVQRHPQAFVKPYASKINILWLHDLALYRTKDLFLSQMWNVDAVFTVSEYHKQQVCEVYDLKPEFVYPILNGVDSELFKKLKDSGTYGINSSKLRNVIDYVCEKNRRILTYSSRPERGLEHLVAPGGIMEQLLEKEPNAHLVVCGYENTTPHMAPFYNMLWERCEELPNVTNVGALTKSDLAQLMLNATLHIYPTEFEEVSCITAMECATANLPFISSYHAALPETCEGSGSILIDLKDGVAHRGSFVDLICRLLSDNCELERLKNLQHERKDSYSWRHAGLVFNNAIIETIDNLKISDNATARHLMRMSDIEYLNNDYVRKDGGTDRIVNSVMDELESCYKFYLDNTYQEHYKNYYQYEKERGVNYGPENLDGNLRFEYVASLLVNVENGSTVLDYGCAHGHYTINLAKRYPKIHFVGVDIEETNIVKAKKWAEGEGVDNVCFKQGTAESVNEKADVIIVAEVLEHIGDIDSFLLDILSHLKECGMAIFTTPYGPWESQGYLEHWPWRAHLYEFSKEDIKYIFQAYTDLDIKSVPSGMSKIGEPLGSYVFTFTKQKETVLLPYKKQGMVIPRKQTLSLCMIVKDAASDIERCLNSVLPICDEVIIGLDQNTTDDTADRVYKTVNNFHIPCLIVDIVSPLEIGFDEVRNRVIEKACGDWIMWLDSDEELHNAEGILPYLRNSQYDGLSIPQHHITAQPPGILKTDIPCKIFRNNMGIKFYGVVHEHPEKEYGKGVEYVCGLPHVSIMHYGYPDEATRRKRFERNLKLLGRDREKYPDRILGKLLWLRDLAQMNKFQMEVMPINDDMLKRCDEAIVLWREILDVNFRMATEGLQFYSDCVRMLGNGFEYRLTLDTSKGDIIKMPEPINVRFFNQEHALAYQTKLLKDKTSNFESKYY